MKILLEDNAMDSLEWSVNFFRTFLEKDPDFQNRQQSSSYLKQGIISLNLSIELFLKMEISKCNELLIYKNIEGRNLDEVFVQFYQKKNNDELYIQTLYDYILEEGMLVQTIDYSECIELYCKLYNIGDGDKLGLIELNFIRNSFMHLGINYKKDYYKLVCTISRILCFIYNNILLKKGEEFILGNELAYEVSDLELKFSEIGRTLWKDIFERQIQLFYDKLEASFETKKVQQYIESKKLKMSFTASAENLFMTYLVLVNGLDDETTIGCFQSEDTNALYLAEQYKDSHVFAVIELDGKTELPLKFYITKKQEGAYIEAVESQKYFWKTKSVKQEFEYVALSKQCIEKLWIIIIDFISSKN